VTIVGGPLGVSSESEALLRAAGCKVERVAGENFTETNALLDKIPEEGRRFLT
jgi:putative cell wall-binding protein